MKPSPEHACTPQGDHAASARAPCFRAGRCPFGGGGWCDENWRAARRHAAGSDWPGRLPPGAGLRCQVERDLAPKAGIGFGVCPLKVARPRRTYNFGPLKPRRPRLHREAARTAASESRRSSPLRQLHASQNVSCVSSAWTRARGPSSPDALVEGPRA